VAATRTTADRSLFGASSIDTRLRRTPVDGSVVLGLMPSQPQPRAAWEVLLKVSDESPALARRDTRLFLATCPDIPAALCDMAVLLVSELATNAYRAMLPIGHPSGAACIDLSLRLFHDRLLVEVTDASPKVPAPRLADDPEAESRRGLAVVDSLSREWGYFRHAGRKTVFCELSLTPGEDTDNGRS
jgi:hypothetical protein